MLSMSCLDADKNSMMRLMAAAVLFTLLMVAAAMLANLWGISGNAKLWLMIPGLVALGWLMMEARRHARTSSGSTPAVIRYVGRMVPLAFLYVAAIIVTINVQRAWHPTGLLAVVFAILPALPLVGCIWAMGRLFVEEDDEYQRAIHARRALIATGFMLTVMTIWGFLESAQIVPHAPAYAAFILWNAGLLFSGLVPAGRRA
jgi:hypothetical protein